MVSVVGKWDEGKRQHETEAAVEEKTMEVNCSNV